jgi:hypothetical protein
VSIPKLGLPMCSTGSPITPSPTFPRCSLGVGKRPARSRYIPPLESQARAAGNLDAATRKDAEAAFDAFIETYGVKYDKAAECLEKDREALLVFYDFPAEHWKHLRTTNHHVVDSTCVYAVPLCAV